jgi:hypothetical protein
MLPYFLSLVCIKQKAVQVTFYLICLLVSSCFSAQAQWNLEKEDNGIKIYTSESSTSPVKSVKVEAIFKGTCQKFISILKEVEKQPQWVYATKQAYLIQEFSATELLYYVETALPWPAKNRDAAVRMIIEQLPSDNQVTITTIGEPNAIPAKNGKTQVTQLKGVWKVKEIEGGKINIEYILDLNPGGSLPAGVVNLFVTKGPYETFINLAKLLEN